MFGERQKACSLTSGSERWWKQQLAEGAVTRLGKTSVTNHWPVLRRCVVAHTLGSNQSKWRVIHFRATANLKSDFLQWCPSTVLGLWMLPPAALRLSLKQTSLINLTEIPLCFRHCTHCKVLQLTLSHETTLRGQVSGMVSLTVTEYISKTLSAHSAHNITETWAEIINLIKHHSLSWYTFILQALPRHGGLTIARGTDLNHEAL